MISALCSCCIQYSIGDGGGGGYHCAPSPTQTNCGTKLCIQCATWVGAAVEWMVDGHELQLRSFVLYVLLRTFVRSQCVPTFFFYFLLFVDIQHIGNNEIEGKRSQKVCHHPFEMSRDEQSNHVECMVLQRYPMVNYCPLPH